MAYWPVANVDPETRVQQTGLLKRRANSTVTSATAFSPVGSNKAGVLLEFRGEVHGEGSRAFAVTGVWG